MLRFALAFTLASALALPAQAQTGPMLMQPATDGPVVDLSVSQQVLGDPDKAMISAGVTTRASTATAAMAQNAAQMTSVLAQLKALGIPDDRVQTTGIQLNPQYNYRNNLPPQFTGYDAVNTVSVELRDLDRVGRVLDLLVASGATNLNGPIWGIVDDAAQRRQARNAAFESAQAQAREYARMTGYSDIRLLAISESMGYSAPVMEAQDLAVSAAPRVQTPTRPGRVATSVNLQIRYELVR